MQLRFKLTLLSLAMIACAPLAAQPVPPPNYDESHVPHYTLPDPLVSGDGQRVATAATWREKRRPELVRLFEENVYGRAPGKPEGVTIQRRVTDAAALGGKAVRKEVTIRFKPGRAGEKIDVLILLPRQSKRPVPVFLGLNFDGNQTIHADPGITPSDLRAKRDQPPGKPRGADAHQWQAEKILARGYGLATAWYGDIEPDFPGGIRLGVRQLYLKPGQSEPGDNEWGAIAAWAWGLSRIMDYLQTDADIDARHVTLIGHSRLGKTALWAGAQTNVLQW